MTRRVGQRVPQELHERSRPALDRRAEEVGRVGPERAAGRYRVAPVAPAVGPRDRLRPLRLQVRAGRAVEERLLQLSPSPLERDPRICGLGGRTIARDGLHSRRELPVRPLRVVAADTGLGGAPEPERRRVLVRVRAGGRVDDRVASRRRPRAGRPPTWSAWRPRGRCSRPPPDRDRAPRRRRSRRRRAGSSPSRLRACC